MKKKTRNIVIIIGVFCILWVIGRLVGPPPESAPVKSTNNSSSQKGVVTESIVRTMGNAFIKQNLKAPSSADFPLNEWKAYQTGETWVYRGAVDAQNSFGAKVRSWYLLELKYKGRGDVFDYTNWILMSIKEQ